MICTIMLPIMTRSLAPYKQKTESGMLSVLEATTGFEPVMEVLQTSALPLGDVAISI